MNDSPTNNFYFWCCIAQSIVIIALAFYIGKEKISKGELLKEKERNAFALRISESEISRLKAMVDTCYGGKK